MVEEMKLRKFQRIDLKKIDLKFDGCCLLAWDQGLGKTIEFIAYRKLHPEFKTTLVVCKAGLKIMWQRQIKKFLGINAYICEGQRPPATLPKKPNIVIINYEILWYWLKWLAGLKIDLIGIDECQNIMNPATERAKAIVSLCFNDQWKIPHRIPMSGTPLMNKPAELWPALHIMNPERYNSMFEFGSKYCRPVLDRGKWKFPGARRLPELHEELIEHGMIRRLKKDVLKDLADKVREVIPVEMSDPKQYRSAEQDFEGWLGSKNPYKLNKAKRAKALAQIQYLIQLAAKLKLKAVVNWINTFLEDTDEKLVVACTHHKMMEALERRCKTKSVLVHGKIVGAKRQHNIDQFIHDKNTRLLIGNHLSVGTGVDGLQKVCTNLAVVQLPFRPADLSQLSDRIHRIGQEGVAIITILLAADTIEELLASIIERKQKIIDKVLDGGQGYDEMAIMTELMVALKRKAS